MTKNQRKRQRRNRKLLRAHMFEMFIPSAPSQSFMDFVQYLIKVK